MKYPEVSQLHACSGVHSSLFEQVCLDVFQHGQQLLLHLGLWNRHLIARVSPDCHALMLLHVFWTHFHADGNPLNEAQLIGYHCRCDPSLRLCVGTELLLQNCSDLQLPVVELPARGVVVSEVGLHPDASRLQSV